MSQTLNNQDRQLNDTTFNGMTFQRYILGGDSISVAPRYPQDPNNVSFVGYDGKEAQTYRWNPEGGMREDKYQQPVTGEELEKVKENHNKAFNKPQELEKGGNVEAVDDDPLVKTIKKALQGDAESQALITQFIQQNPDQEPLVKEIMQKLQSEVAMQKCGGKVKKKKAEKGVKLPFAKNGCTCHLRKVGGRLIEVDSCTGLPVHKSGGMIKKFATPAGPVQHISGDDIKGAYLHRDGRNRYYKIHNGNLYSADTPLIGNWITSMSLTGWDQMTPEIATGMGLTRGVMGDKSIYFKQNENTGLYNAYGEGVDSNAVYGRHIGADGKARYYSNYGATDATWDANTGSWTREGYTYNPQSGGWTQNPPAADPAAAPAQPAAAAPAPAPAPAPAQTDAEAIEAYIASLSPSQQLYARRTQQNKGAFTADELAGLDAETQGLLNPNDKLRLQKIQRAQAQNAEALTQSLTFNGQTYADKDAYNSAVNTYNTGLETNRNSTINTAVGAAFGKDSRHAQAAASALADAQAFAGSKTMDKRAFKQYMRNNETGGARFRNRAWKAYQALDQNAMQAKQAEQYKDPELIDYSQYKTGGRLNYGHYFQ